MSSRQEADSDVLGKFDLTEKTALITGAAGLLGLHHAAALLDSGATVVLTDINEANLASTGMSLMGKADSDRIITRVMDVCRPEDISTIAE